MNEEKRMAVDDGLMRRLEGLREELEVEFERYLEQNTEYVFLSKIVNSISGDFVDLLNGAEKKIFLKLVDEERELVDVIKKSFLEFAIAEWPNIK